MKDSFEITSLQNPKIKNAIKLFDRRDRNETGLFLIEGYRELLRAIKGGIVIRTLFTCQSFFLGENEPTLIEHIQNLGAEVFCCSSSVFKKLSYRDRPDGLIGVAVQMKHSLGELFARIPEDKEPFLLVAEAIEKPGNLGTILRSSDAVGCHGVIVCDKCTDIYNPNVVRASVGTLFTLPVIEASGVETLLLLKQKNIKIIAATPHAKEEFTEADLSGSSAIVVGTEQLGLSELWMKAADIQVRIPMHGVADSLNVASASTLLLYEILRQRKVKDSRLWI